MRMFVYAIDIESYLRVRVLFSKSHLYESFSIPPYLASACTTAALFVSESPGIDTVNSRTSVRRQPAASESAARAIAACFVIIFLAFT